MRVPYSDPALPSVRELAMLTIPQMGLMACHLCISLTDIWVAGQIDAAALSALGVVSQIFALLLLITSLAGSGCMATVSQAVGGAKHERAKRYAALVLCSCCILGSVVGLLGLAVLPLALGWLHLPPPLHEAVRIFVLAYCCHLPPFFCMVMMNSIFRAHKMVWLPLATLVLVALVNFTGSVGFGLGRWGLPPLGYAGVAWATVASSLAGLACNTTLLLGKGIVARRLPPWRWVRTALPRLWRIGMPAALGQWAGQMGSLALLGCLSSLPDTAAAVAAVAGMTLGQRVLGALHFTSAALGMTLTICSGHLLGARQGRACYILGQRLALGTGLVLALCAALLYAGHARVAAWFATDAATLREAGLFLSFACLSLPLQGTAHMLHSVFAGAGQTRLVTLTSLAGMWLVAVPLAFALSRGLGPWQGLGPSGVYAAMTLGYAVMALLSWHFYRKRQWLVAFVSAC